MKNTSRTIKYIGAIRQVKNNHIQVIGTLTDKTSHNRSQAEPPQMKGCPPGQESRFKIASLVVGCCCNKPSSTQWLKKQTFSISQFKTSEVSLGKNQGVGKSMFFLEAAEPNPCLFQLPQSSCFPWFLASSVFPGTKPIIPILNFNLTSPL